MEVWFDLQDVWRAKNLRSTYSAYRERVSRSHARHVRHLRTREISGGRPRHATVVDRTGLLDLVGDLVEQVEFTAMPVPLRFKDSVRQQMVGVNLFSTYGLEPQPQDLNREQFMDWLRQRPELADQFLEEDFENI